MISLSDSEQTALKAIVQSYATDQPYRVVVFGSRATGRARKYSDVDLALIGQRTVPWKTIVALAEAFDDSELPYTVDIVDFTQASPAMQEQIERDGVEVVRL